MFMFLKQSKEMKIPFCLSSSDSVGGVEKPSRKIKKERKENCFPLSDKATGIIIIYVKL